jgi:hypothetical protein
VPAWLLVLLAVLATARLTRLVARDAISDPARAWLHERGPEWLTYLVHCPWCVSIWLGAGVAAATYNWPARWWVVIPLVALTASYVTGALALLTARLEDRDA